MILRNVTPLQLYAATEVLRECGVPPAGEKVSTLAWSVAQSSEGNLFVTITTIHSAEIRMRWAMIDPQGGRLRTIWCEESCIREGARLGRYELTVLLADPDLANVTEAPR